MPPRMPIGAVEGFCQLMAVKEVFVRLSKSWRVFNALRGSWLPIGVFPQRWLGWEPAEQGASGSDQKMDLLIWINSLARTSTMLRL